MKKIKKKILPIANIVIPLVSFAILLFCTLSDRTLYFMIFTLFIGWTIPYFVAIVSGFALFKNLHPKLTLTFNVVNILLCTMLIVFIITLYDKYFLVFLIEYIILALLSLINSIYYIIYIKKHPNKENIKIKEIKKANNGAIV